MQIENNKEEVPFSYYENLFKDLKPEEAAARTGAKWDGKEFSRKADRSAGQRRFYPGYHKRPTGRMGRRDRRKASIES